MPRITSPSLFDIRDEMSTALSAVFAQKSYGWLDVVQPPCAIIDTDTIDYELTFDPNNVAYNFDVIVVVALTPTAEIAAQTLDRYLSPFGDDSVPQALLADPTLGGLVSTLMVHGVREYGEMKIQGEIYFAAKVKVEVLV